MSYNKIEIFGGCDINYLWNKNELLSEDDINSLREISIHSPSWDLDTNILATFNNSTDASNLKEMNIVAYRIQKRNIKEKVLRTVANVDKENVKIVDYNVANGETYKYYITAITEVNGEQVFATPVETNEITPDWSSWSVIGLKEDKVNVYEIDTDNVWVFNLNLEPGDYASTFFKVYTEGIGRFPKGFSTSTNYIKGKLSCYMGDINCISEYINDDALKIEKWNAFCNNGELKLIRDTKGNVYLADIDTTSFTTSDYVNGKPTTLSFSFVQLGDTKNICVFKVVS